MTLAWWIGVIGVPLISFVFAVDFYIHRNAQAERGKVIDGKAREIDALHTRINALNNEFYEYKLGATKVFATVHMVAEVKREIGSRLERIEDKLDRIVDRNDRRDRL